MIASGEVPRPAFIKCDTEGAELKVFGGGREMLDRPDAPIILFEANVHNTGGFGFQVSDAMEFLGGLPSPRFRFYRVAGAGLPERIENFRGEHANILAVPEARRDRWAELS